MEHSAKMGEFGITSIKFAKSSEPGGKRALQDQTNRRSNK